MLAGPDSAQRSRTPPDPAGRPCLENSCPLRDNGTQRRLVRESGRLRRSCLRTPLPLRRLRRSFDEPAPRLARRPAGDRCPAWAGSGGASLRQPCASDPPLLGRKAAGACRGGYTEASRPSKAADCRARQPSTAHRRPMASMRAVMAAAGSAAPGCRGACPSRQLLRLRWPRRLPSGQTESRARPGLDRNGSRGIVNAEQNNPHPQSEM